MMHTNDLKTGLQMNYERAVREYFRDADIVKNYDGGYIVALVPTEAEVVRRHLGSGARVLDVGSGGGREAVGLLRLGYEVVGVDHSWELVQMAREVERAQGRSERVRGWVVADAVSLPFKEGIFHGVVMFNTVLQFVHGRARRLEALRESRRVMKSGGRAVVHIWIQNAVPTLDAMLLPRAVALSVRVMILLCLYPLRLVVQVFRWTRLKILGPSPDRLEPGDRNPGRGRAGGYLHLYTNRELVRDTMEVGLKSIETLNREGREVRDPQSWINALRSGEWYHVMAVNK